MSQLWNNSVVLTPRVQLDRLPELAKQVLSYCPEYRPNHILSQTKSSKANQAEAECNQWGLFPQGCTSVPWLNAISDMAVLNTDRLLG